jgi:hypothetical protein
MPTHACQASRPGKPWFRNQRLHTLPWGPTALPWPEVHCMGFRNVTWPKMNDLDVTSDRTRLLPCHVTSAIFWPDFQVIHKESRAAAIQGFNVGQRQVGKYWSKTGATPRCTHVFQTCFLLQSIPRCLRCSILTFNPFLHSLCGCAEMGYIARSHYGLARSCGMCTWA